MSDKIYNEKINKLTDWGGDASTGGLPVSGERVQEFIKESLNSKFGNIHYDTNNSRYLVFADADSRDKYLSNTVLYKDLLLATFLAPSAYTARIMMQSPVNNVLFVKQKNNYIEFTFDIVNKDEASTGEAVMCTYTFINNNDKKVVTERYKPNQSVRFKIDEYVTKGVNKVTINILGETSLVGTSVGVTYNLIELELTDSFNLTKVHNTTDTVTIPYYVSGAGVKKMEWYLDNELIPEEENDTITQTSINRIKYVKYNNLAHGSHSLQFRCYIESEGEKYYTENHYIKFIVKSTQLTNIIGYSCLIPELVTDTIRIDNIKQYESFTIRYTVYNPQGLSSQVSVYNNESVLSNTIVNNSDIINYIFRPTIIGEQSLSIVNGDVREDILFNVDKSAYAIEEITDNLTLDLRALGRSNNDVNKDSWSFGNINTVFNGFGWNSQSGWNGQSLQVKSGSNIVIDYQPFISNDVKVKGLTLEFDLCVKNIEKLDSVILNCSKNGTGAYITSNEIVLNSLSNKQANTYYKQNEQVRVSFVIHPTDNDNFKQLMIIYVNGVINSINNYIATDTFLNDSHITIGGTGADVDIASIRAYSRSLSPDEVLNNTMLYQSDVNEMLKIYDNNDIYEPNTYNLSIDKISAKCPVMLFTGDVPAILNTKDKNLTIYLDEIEFINRQKPHLQFKGSGVRLKPQGTSSMQYPIKNFRFYLKYGTTYNNEGEVITATKIQDHSQPVSTFCLKADYAESSGTHNTGVARLWNDALFNVKIGNDYVCRTAAQKAALANNYQYDVRTAIDGYPIALFYRTSKDSPLVFIGHYNYNNDKSTENVFGFKDIPGFNNTNMACWEHLNNTHPIGLFTEVNNFDSVWGESFEARYPEDYQTHHLQALKSFATWVNSTKDNVNKFKSEKAAHLDMYKMAAYYVYLMRFGAVDQVVKNAMLTTEDGQHYYYIHYDNDTINGLRNDGLRAYDTDINRQSIDTDFENLTYAYAGHDSVLWNNLEADSEFMEFVKQIDNALYQAGMSYRDVIDMFDTKQMSKWSERIYNEDAKIKYIKPLQDEGINNLFMCQGNRQQHRRYWLSNRFALYDSIWASGEYKSSVIDIKVANGEGSFTVTSGKDNSYFGYGINNVVIESGHLLDKDESVTFTTPRVLAIGDPLRIYNAHLIKSVDISNFQQALAQLNLNSVYNSEMGTKLESLILGSSSKSNTSLSEISGLKQAKNLKSLDIRGFKGLKSIDLSEQYYLTNLLASRSELASVMLAKAAPVNRLDLPATMNNIELDSLPISNNNLTIEGNGTNLRTVTIRNCSNLDTKAFVFNWLTNKTATPLESYLTLTNINWTGVTVAQLKELKAKVSNIDISGIIELTSCTQDEAMWILDNYGYDSFNPSSTLYIKLPAGFVDFIHGSQIVKQSTTSRYVALFNNNNKSIVYGIEGAENGIVAGYCTMNTTTGLLTASQFDNDKDIKIFAHPIDNPLRKLYKDIKLVSFTYPTSGTIEGDSSLDLDGKSYTFSTLDEYDGVPTYEWSISQGSEYCEIVSSNGNTAIVKAKSRFPDAKAIKLRCKLVKPNGTDVLIVDKVLNNPIGLTSTIRFANIIDDKSLDNVTVVPHDNSTGIINITKVGNDYRIEYDTSTGVNKVRVIGTHLSTAVDSYNVITLPTTAMTINHNLVYRGHIVLTVQSDDNPPVTLSGANVSYISTNSNNPTTIIDTRTDGNGRVVIYNDNDNPLIVDLTISKLNFSTYSGIKEATGGTTTANHITINLAERVEPCVDFIIETNKDNVSVYVKLGVYNSTGVIDWGDGTTDTIGTITTTSNNNPQINHTYTKAGQYNITMGAKQIIWGETCNWGGSSNTTLKQINKLWDMSCYINGYSVMYYLFNDINIDNNLYIADTAFDNYIVSRDLNGNYVTYDRFSNTSRLCVKIAKYSPIVPTAIVRLLDIKGSEILSLEYCFNSCTSLTTLPTGIFDKLVNIKSLNAAFLGCTSLTTLPTGIFDKCVNLEFLNQCLSGCTSLTTLPTGLLDKCNRISYIGMFLVNCSKLNQPYNLTSPELPKLWERSNIQYKDSFAAGAHATFRATVPTTWGGTMQLTQMANISQDEYDTLLDRLNRMEIMLINN